jgi:hypothetical protein
MDSLPNPFMEAGKCSTFDETELLAALESILLDVPAFLACPSEEFLDLLMEQAA